MATKRPSRRVTSLTDHLKSQLALGNLGAMPLAPQVTGSMRKDGFYVWTRTAPQQIMGMRVVQRNGAYVVHEVTLLVTEDDASQTITSASFRSIPFGEITAAARSLASNTAGVISNAAQEQLDDLLQPWRQDARTTGARRDDLAYAALSLRYVMLLGSGNSRPTDTLARDLGMSPITASQRLRECRQKGLLTATTAGRAGGELTPAAMALLAHVVGAQGDVT